MSGNPAGTYRQWLPWGIAGALLMLLGDWLLGYIDPGILVAGNPILRAGYAQDYALWRPVAAMITGSLGVILYLPGLWGMGLMLTSPKTRKAYGTATAAGFLGWLFIHYFFCQLIYQYAWGIQTGDASALQSADAVYRAFAVPFYGWYLLMDVPFLIHLAAMLRGNSLLPRRAALLHPLPVILFLRILTHVLPQTPFVYGLGMGAMNEGMIIWFAAALAAHRKDSGA